MQVKTESNLRRIQDMILTDHFLLFGRPYMILKYQGQVWADQHPFCRELLQTISQPKFIPELNSFLILPKL